MIRENCFHILQIQIFQTHFIELICLVIFQEITEAICIKSKKTKLIIEMRESGI